MAKGDVYEVQTIKLTSPAACGAVLAVLNTTDFEDMALCDTAYAICRALGFTVGPE